MDWTSWAGRSGPDGLDALRLLVLLHRLGEETAEATDDAVGDDGDRAVRELRGERTVQHLDHLLAHPATLAYLLMDAFLHGDDQLADRRGALARRVRWLLANDRRRNEPGRRGRGRRRGQNPSPRVHSARRHRFRPFVWRRRDDVLGGLQCRGLLRVIIGPRTPASPSDGLRYRLTGRAASWLSSEVYSAHGDSGFHAQVCTVISDFLHDLETVPESLAATGDRLIAFRRGQGLGADDDTAAPRFYRAFREGL